MHEQSHYYCRVSLRSRTPRVSLRKQKTTRYQSALQFQLEISNNTYLTNQSGANNDIICCLLAGITNTNTNTNVNTCMNVCECESECLIFDICYCNYYCGMFCRLVAAQIHMGRGEGGLGLVYSSATAPPASFWYASAHVVSY